ncbi:MAG: hypothetical protein WC858_03085 [Parcubacteria group bacterium]|jgi:hypothetical protein
MLQRNAAPGLYFTKLKGDLLWVVNRFFDCLNFSETGPPDGEWRQDGKKQR